MSRRPPRNHPAFKIPWGWIRGPTKGVHPFVSAVTDMGVDPSKKASSIFSPRTRRTRAKYHRALVSK